ncbi:MAG TPA: regulator, partial [Saprospiraceae bacterium]|nr:regulator [Saprospiraceae bacterium]
NELTNEVKHWNKNNSILQAVTGDSTRTRISGLTFDKNENLWISNYGAPKPLAVKTKDNTWHNFSVPGSTNLNEIVIDQSGNKWIAVFGVGNGVIVYNEGSKIADPTDDKVRSITRTNSEIVGNKVNCVMVDLDGSVWVGTDQGPVIFDCGDPFSETCRGTTRKVVVEGIPAPLLRYEDIISMAVDGANRKWFGTRNGIFVQSPDGVTEVARYTSKNSPLLDNTVRTLAYNGYTGEMFIVTPGGIQSFKTETTSGSNSHSSSVVAFPNPVRPDYTGPIAIKGLVRDANVKITDINGKLVYETKALGGQAIWDGMDYNGSRAATGVYLVFSANENTSLPSDALVTKILIVR